MLACSARSHPPVGTVDLDAVEADVQGVAGGLPAGARTVWHRQGLRQGVLSAPSIAWPSHERMQ